MVKYNIKNLAVCVVTMVPFVLLVILEAILLSGCSSLGRSPDKALNKNKATICSDSNLIAYITEDGQIFHIYRVTESESRTGYIPEAEGVVKIFGSDQKIVYLDEKGSVTTYYLGSGESEKMSGSYDDLFFNGIDFLAVREGDNWEIIESRYDDVQMENVIQVGCYFGGEPSAAIYKDGSVKALELDAPISSFQKDKIDEWRDSSQIACTIYNIYALGKDGKVYGDMGEKWNAGEEKKWEDIIQLEATDWALAGLNSSGKVVVKTLNDPSRGFTEAEEWENISRIHINPWCIIAVDNNGRLLCTEHNIYIPNDIPSARI